MDFILSDNNPYILLIAIVSGLMLLWPTLMRGSRATVAPVSEAVRLSNQHNGIFIDVRPHDRFKAGTIAQARNIPLADIDAKINTLPKDKPLIVFCDHGRISVGAANKLRKSGFEHVVSLEGGLAKWVEAGMPTSGKH